jgi:preprotein translocase subunit YajC
MSNVSESFGLLLLQSGSQPNMLIPFVLMIVIFYVVLFLPMRRRQKKTDEMLSNLKTGDKVVTNGGLIGVVAGLSDKAVVLRTKPDNVKIEFARSAVTGLAAEDPKE